MEADEDIPFTKQVEALYAMVEQLEDAVAEAAKRERSWDKERARLEEARVRLEKKIASADDDVRFIKEHLDQSKKEKEQTAQGAKKEREQMATEIKQLRERNQQLKQNVEKVTSKLDAAISKIGALMEG